MKMKFLPALDFLFFSQYQLLLPSEIQQFMRHSLTLQRTLAIGSSSGYFRVLFIQKLYFFSFCQLPFDTFGWQRHFWSSSPTEGSLEFIFLMIIIFIGIITAPCRLIPHLDNTVTVTAHLSCPIRAIDMFRLLLLLLLEDRQHRFLF